MNEEKNIQKLKETLEGIRSSKYPQVPSTLVSQIVDLQIENVEKKSKTLNQVKNLIINSLPNE